MHGHEIMTYLRNLLIQWHRAYPQIAKIEKKNGIHVFRRPRGTPT